MVYLVTDADPNLRGGVAAENHKESIHAFHPAAPGSNLTSLSLIISEVVSLIWNIETFSGAGLSLETRLDSSYFSIVSLQSNCVNDQKK